MAEHLTDTNVGNVEYISKAELYKQIAEKEELARNRYLDTPSTLPVPIFVNPSYERYTAQLNERTAFKHMVADFPPADVVPYSIDPDDTLTVTVPKGTKRIGRILIEEDGTRYGGLFYPDTGGCFLSSTEGE